MNNSLEFLNFLNWNNHDGINLPMINDFMRNQFYDNILHNNVKDKHCLDIGFGTGLLSILALKHGAKSIIAYESDQTRYLLGCEILKRMNLEKKITLIHSRYHCTDFEKHNAEVIFSETVNGGLWNEGLWQSFPRHPGVQFLPGKYYLDIIAIEVPESFALGLTKEINDQQCFSPGIDIDLAFVECINNLSNRDNISIDPCPDGVIIISNINTIWGWMPYMRLAEYNGVSIAGYTVDAIENTVTITDAAGTCMSAIDFTIDKFNLNINTKGWKDKCMLLVPRAGMKHNDSNLILDTGHWGPVNCPALIKNIKADIKITHNIQDGIVTYS